MKQILRANIYGDSIMKGTVLDNAYHYRAIMNRYLPKLYDRFGIEAENRARFGITVQRGHKILQRDISEGLDCELALVEFGGNDSNFHWDEISLFPTHEHLPFTSMTDFTGNLTAMIDELRQQSVQPIMMTLPPIDPQRYFDFIVRNGNSRENILAWLGSVQKIYDVHASYSSAAASVAMAKDVPLVDIRSEFPHNDALGEYICIDGIHPNEKGYRLIADTFASFFERMIA